MLTESEVRRMVDHAWRDAQLITHSIAAEVQAETNSPAVRAAAAGSDAAATAAQRVFVEHILGHIYAGELALAIAVFSGTLSQAAASTLIGKARGFCQFAAAEMRCFCSAKPCDYVGPLDEAGPTGYCPKCDKLSIRPSPQIAKKAPPPPPRLVEG